MIRAFVAIDISPAMQDALRDVQRKLRSVLNLHASWVRPDHFHLTVRFLGALAREQVTNLCERLETIRCSPFELRLTRAGCFPNLRRPRILWAGLREEPELVRLQASVETACEHIGLSKEQKLFHAHVTLARLKDGVRNPAFFQQFISEIKLSASCGVHEMTLYQSILDQGGPIYRKIAGFRFAD